VISTQDAESGISFSPDGSTAWLTKMSLPGTFGAIVFSQRTGGAAWSEPEVAPFSGLSSDLHPAVSPDGSRIFFSSARPVDGTPRADYDLWVVERRGAGWGEPRHVGAPVSSPGQELHPSVAADGTLYFYSARPGSGGADIYRARPAAGGGWAEPERLPEAVNSPAPEKDPWISADGSTLIFVSTGRPGGLGRDDLYISTWSDGAWTSARNLGPGVNFGANENAPSLSPDGRTLFYSSDLGFGDVPPPRPLTYRELIASLESVRNGLENIYTTDLPIIQP
jgi:Tol biopolymer transport system component